MRAWSWIACGACALALGCGQTVPTFPPIGRDAGLECGDEEGLAACPTGQVCLQGFCYGRCSDTSPCGPLELCSEGVCVSLAGRDGGVPPDAGPPDPCDTAGCVAPTPYCRNGVCLACETAADCIGMDPNTICDLGRGGCVPNGPAVCAPCNAAGNCTDASGTLPAMRCVDRGAPGPTERVCLPTCTDGMCPVGFACDAGSMDCLPVLNTSCTGMRAALERRACSDDAGCAPAGATFSDGRFVGSCFDPAGGDALVCHQPCSVDDCPSGLTCDTAMGFCL